MTIYQTDILIQSTSMTEIHLLNKIHGVTEWNSALF